ncbi:MAG: hypothetical protein Ct9H300mP1_29940 [Planctomycetaceae bacterium]|nr:MAG: hypothetical protein Ct9H300mP1_29940 [Planctomycetaceae bacterium]
MKFGQCLFEFLVPVHRQCLFESQDVLSQCVPLRSFGPQLEDPGRLLPSLDLDQVQLRVTSSSRTCCQVLSLINDSLPYCLLAPPSLAARFTPSPMTV